MHREHLGAARVVIDDLGALAEAMLDLAANDCRDLLRSPGRTSTAAPAGSVGRVVEDLYAHQVF